MFPSSRSPTHFVSLDGGYPQTTPEVPDLGLSSRDIAATRSALSAVGKPVAAHSRTPLPRQPEVP